MSFSELYRLFKRRTVEIERLTENEERLPSEAELEQLMVAIQSMQKMYPPRVAISSESKSSSNRPPLSVSHPASYVNGVKPSLSQARRGSHLPRKDDDYIWKMYTTCNPRYAWTDPEFAVPRGTIGVMARKLNWTPQKVMGRIQVLKGLRPHTSSSESAAEFYDSEDDGTVYSVDDSEDEEDDNSTFNVKIGDSDDEGPSKFARTSPNGSKARGHSSFSNDSFTFEDDKMILDAYSATHDQDVLTDSPSSKKRKAMTLLANSDFVDVLAAKLHKTAESVSARLAQLLDRRPIEPPALPLASSSSQQRKFTRQEDLFIWNAYLNNTMSEVNSPDMSFNAPRGKVRDLAEDMDITIPQFLGRFKDLKAEHLQRLAESGAVSASKDGEETDDAVPMHNLLPMDFLSKIKTSGSSHSQSQSSSSSNAYPLPSSPPRNGSYSAPREYPPRGREPPHNFTKEEDRHIWDVYVAHTNNEVTTSDMSFNAPSGTVSQLAEDLKVSTQQVLGRFKQLKARQVQEMTQKRYGGDSKTADSVVKRDEDGAIDKLFRSSLPSLSRMVHGSRGLGYNPPFTVEQDIYLWDAYLASTHSPVDGSNMGFNAPRGTVNVIARDLSVDIPQLMNRFRYLKAHYVRLLNGPPPTRDGPAQEAISNEASGGRSLRPKGWQPHRLSIKPEPTEAADADTSPAVRDVIAEPPAPIFPFTVEDDEKIWATYVQHTESDAASKDMRFNAPEGTVGKLAESVGRLGGSGIQLVLNRFRAIKTHRLRLGLTPGDPMVPPVGVVVSSRSKQAAPSVASASHAAPTMPTTSIATVSVTSSNTESKRDDTSLTTTTAAVAASVKAAPVAPPAQPAEKPFTAADDDLIWTKYNLARRKKTPEEKSANGAETGEAGDVEGMVARLVTELVAALGHSEERTLRRIQKVVEEHRTNVHK